MTRPCGIEELRNTPGSLLNPDVIVQLTVHETYFTTEGVEEGDREVTRTHEEVYVLRRGDWPPAGDGTNAMLEEVEDIFKRAGVEMLMVLDRNNYSPDGSFIVDYATGERCETCIVIDDELSMEWRVAIYNRVRSGL